MNNKSFFNVSNIISSNTFNPNQSTTSKKNVEKNVEKNVQNNIKKSESTDHVQPRDKIKAVKKKMETKDKKSIVNYDEASRKPVTFPKKFDWRLYAKIVNHPSVNNEEKAIDHFKRYAHNQSKLAKLYFRAIYVVPQLFDEDTYIDYLKTFGLELDKKTIEIEKLYHFFYKTGKLKYPLNDTYSRMLFKIPYHFDYITYCNRYPNVQFDKDDVNSIYDYFSSEKNTKHQLDDEYGRLRYDIPNYFDANVFKARYSLSFESDFDAYEFYSKNCDKNFSLDDRYLHMRFNIPEDFDISNYKKRYQETKNMEKVELYTFYNDNKNTKGLDDAYYRIIYNIPELFTHNIYLIRYPNIKCDKDFISVYKYFNERGEVKEVLDDKYYRILFNIPDYFSANIFSSIYPSTPTNTVDLYKFYKDNRAKYPLNEKYFTSFFKITDDHFNSQAYRQTFFNGRDVSLYELFKHYSENKENDSFYIKLLNLDSNFNWEKYLEDNSDLFEEKYLDIDNIFIYNFISNNISLKEIYDIYRKQKDTDKTKLFKTRYDFLENYKDNINSEDDRRFYFYLYDFNKEYYNNDKVRKDYYQQLSKAVEDKTMQHKLEVSIKKMKESILEEKIIDHDDIAFNLVDDDNILGLYQKYLNKTYSIDNSIISRSFITNFISEISSNNPFFIDHYNSYLTKENINYSNKNKINIEEIKEKLLNEDLEEDEKQLNDKILECNNLIKLLLEIENSNLTMSLQSRKKELISNLKSCFFKDFNYDKCLDSFFYNNIEIKEEIFSNLNIELYNIYTNKQAIENVNNLNNNSNKEIVFFLLNSYSHNIKLLDHILTIFDKSWKLTVVCNNSNLSVLSNYKNINYINLLYLDDNVITVNDFNELMFNEKFWSSFNCEYLLVLNSNVFVKKNIYDTIIDYNIAQENRENSDDDNNNENSDDDNNSENSDKMELDICSLETENLVLLNKHNYVKKPFVFFSKKEKYIQSISNYNKNGYPIYAKSEISKFKKKYNLDNYPADYIFSLLPDNY